MHKEAKKADLQRQMNLSGSQREAKMRNHSVPKKKG